MDAQVKQSWEEAVVQAEKAVDQALNRLWCAHGDTLERSMIKERVWKAINLLVSIEKRRPHEGVVV